MKFTPSNADTRIFVEKTFQLSPTLNVLGDFTPKITTVFGWLGIKGIFLLSIFFLLQKTARGTKPFFRNGLFDTRKNNVGNQRKTSQIRDRAAT